MSEKIASIERQIFELTRELNQLRGRSEGEEVRNYSFEKLNGPVTPIQILDPPPGNG